MAVAVKGLDGIVKSFNKQARGIKGATLGGLWEAGLLFQGEAMRLVPVEYGNLRGSAYTRRAIGSPQIQIEKTDLEPSHKVGPDAVEVGFGAAYAFYVHENLEMKLAGKDRPSGLGVYWGPAGESKFLEKSIQRNRAEALQIIVDAAKRGMKKQ